MTSPASQNGATTAISVRRESAHRPISGKPVGPPTETSQKQDVDSGEHTWPQVSVIVPTYNEAENIAPLLKRLDAAMSELDYEIVVVDDDSQDSTWRIAERIALTDNRIRVVHRVGERGLSSAVLAGMATARGQSLLVIDADLQHDESKIPDLVGAVLTDGADICLGSREIEGGSYGAFQRHRRLVSWTGAAMARKLLGLPVSDPMSGFFVISRERFELLSDDVNPRGFKILLEFLARGPKPTVAEVGYEFGERVNGTTKLNSSVALAYLVALSSLMVQRLRRRVDNNRTEPRPAGDSDPARP